MTESECKAWGKVLMEQHGLIEAGWTFQIGSSKRRVAACRHNVKVLEYSKHYLGSTEAQIVNTILHEIAHALVGPGQGHNDVWRRKAISIGSDGKRCAAPDEKSDAKPSYRIKCPSCNRKWDRFRKPRQSMHTATCSVCRVQVKIYRINQEA